MSLPSKVLWAEGQSLGPQQFQQLDRYHEARLQRTAAALNPHLWGLRAVQWNLDGLANQRLQADALSLIFQDGEIYEAPATDALPLAVDLSRLPGEEQRFTFYAALPALKPQGGNMARPDARSKGARYAQVELETLDLFTDAVSTQMAYLRNTVRLLSHLEARDGYLSFPLVRLLRMADGRFEIDPAFMPPCLSVAADATLQRMLDCLLEKLTAKAEALYQRHRQSGKDTLEAHSGDLSSFWMLNTICTASAPLLHCARYRLHHPERLFDKLMGLAGGLMTFSTKHTLASLPAYQHDHPGPAFATLDLIIRELIDTVLSSRYFKIALVQDEQKSTHYLGLLDPARAGRQSTLCLAVSADMPALELVAAVPLRFKIGAPDDMENLIVRALPGVELVHMAQVPPEVPVRPNTYYFALGSKSALYENMLKAQAITLYAPAGMNGLKLELFGIAA